MTIPPLKTINEVISILDAIIAETEKDRDPLGYFAILYRKVTIKVKEGIETHFFEDPERMEKLDIIFAHRYIDAYYAWKNNQAISKAWEKAFLLSKNTGSLVFQHLLIGMNAHINLDLGIAAAEISTAENVKKLKNDFHKINEILSSLVDEVQFGLSSIWPALRWILSKFGNIDNYLIDFSMEIARDGAWNFTNSIIKQQVEKWPDTIQLRDLKVAEKSKIITHPGKWMQFLLWIIRLGERGSVSQKMEKLKSVPLENLTPQK